MAIYRISSYLRSMSLRMRILLFLFLFALVPLLLAVAINLPLVLERVDLFYRHALLQNLRADFSDLDQHLASRDANVRLLARLPEPGLLIGGEQAGASAEIDQARVRYIQWINRIFDEERDISQILFIDADGVGRFWLDREVGGGSWAPSSNLPQSVVGEQVQLLLQGKVKKVLLSPLHIDLKAGNPARALTLQMLAVIPAVDKQEVIGVVAITIDIGGLVRRDPGTLWIRHNGKYLRLPDQDVDPPGNAFDDYPGLEPLLAKKTIVLWEQGDRRMIWVPMFVTDSGLPLWVAREVNDQPLRVFRSEVVFRVLLIVFGLIVMLLLAARIIAKRAERISSELTGGIQRTLETDNAVTFEWKDTRELQQLSADLTRLSDTHASQTRNLRAHTRELEASNRYKSEFLANVSHELRTPLNSILLLSKLLSGDQSSLRGEAREQAEVIYKAGCDLKALIDNILDLSRIEAGRLDLHVERVNISELLEDLRALLAPQFADKQLLFEVCVEADTPVTLSTDVDKVRQVLKNFLANAVKFTQQGRVLLLARPAASPYAIELMVRDSGVGIPKEKQARIFEAFRQADGATNRRYGGTGLGLTISRQLAGLLGGEIRLFSLPGEGADFSLLIPAELTDHAAAPLPSGYSETPALAEPEDIQPEVSLQGVQVLLMDYEIRSQLHIQQILRGWGVGLHLADDEEEALETLDDLGQVGVILIDVFMPGLDACATISRIRKQIDTDTIIIGLLESGDDESREHCLYAGVDDFISKPVDASELAGVLLHHLPEVSL